MTSHPVHRAHGIVHPAFTVGTIDPRLFGSFVEHLGRGVYGGLLDPSHESADADGFRTDVLALVEELGVTTVRYPGGNFVSAYDWRDGIGPVEDRPVRLDPAWHTVEPNRFGVDEFVRWCRAARVEPMMALNLGTDGIRSALHLLEYANHPGGTTLSDERRANGADEAHGIRLWCIGNEMDGPWQIGHLSADEYGRLAARTAAAMRALDPCLELIVCGSSNDRMATFGAWEQEVLLHTIEHVDFVSCHQYFRYDGDLAAFLASGVAMDRFITAIADTIGQVRAQTRSERPIAISFDEWNVWDFVAHDERVAGGLEWEEAPRLLEDRYTAADAVVVGDMLISMINRADIVRAASMAQLVNVIGPIMTEPDGPAWRQSTFWPFAQARRSAGATALRTVVEADSTGGGEDSAPVLAFAAAAHADGSLDLMIVNRATDGVTETTVDLTAFPALTVTEALILRHEDPFATNSAELPDTVTPRLLAVALSDGVLSFRIPAIAWVTVRLSPTVDLG
ncbi:alpha-L-arabinofuranosidase [Rathayibacter sp. AY1G1]|uniref:arabinosylfuranosidase ArfA n=1 Tax=unclassified Rathayibacter TaxID=2609250 RepID=UPI000CE79E3F|nr:MULTISPECIES: alpha-L-arabinofuranosidase C-terminal domain-containing protein [unclassified Rathayibacter]PPF28369.1 alpha-L-arabinofuranosidase [Rathayibacter sp. AY1F2]PPG44077.1 alpha-L-arabinofuranosidase [Rathayibacter sp. AY2B5]PPG53645.1 alpha-L-arabinofuranosidase [Rathayibacter sp. AY1E9]PPH05250.1 alpha-L-arabinofuranosidase [Rathayibacter sp. AY1F6]PPH15208.1 alpha-L-arabinofuranosidase [Rathayibacter sp. AY1G1]